MEPSRNQGISMGNPITTQSICQLITSARSDPREILRFESHIVSNRDLFLPYLLDIIDIIHPLGNDQCAWFYRYFGTTKINNKDLLLVLVENHTRYTNYKEISEALLLMFVNRYPTRNVSDDQLLVSSIHRGSLMYMAFVKSPTNLNMFINNLYIPGGSINDMTPCGNVVAAAIEADNYAWLNSVFDRIDHNTYYPVSRYNRDGTMAPVYFMSGKPLLYGVISRKIEETAASPEMEEFVMRLLDRTHTHYLNMEYAEGPIGENSTPLARAIILKWHSRVVRKILDKGGSPNCRWLGKFSILYMCSALRYFGIVQMLLEHGAYEEHHVPSIITALSNATNKDDEVIVSIASKLFENGSNPNDDNGAHPLLDIISSGAVNDAVKTRLANIVLDARAAKESERGV